MISFPLYKSETRKLSLNDTWRQEVREEGDLSGLTGEGSRDTPSALCEYLAAIVIVAIS